MGAQGTASPKRHSSLLASPLNMDWLNRNTHAQRNAIDGDFDRCAIQAASISDSTVQQCAVDTFALKEVRDGCLDIDLCLLSGESLGSVCVEMEDLGRELVAKARDLLGQHEGTVMLVAGGTTVVDDLTIEQQGLHEATTPCLVTFKDVLHVDLFTHNGESLGSVSIGKKALGRELVAKVRDLLGQPRGIVELLLGGIHKVIDSRSMEQHALKDEIQCLVAVLPLTTEQERLEAWMMENFTMSVNVGTHRGNQRLLRGSNWQVWDGIQRVAVSRDHVAEWLAEHLLW